MKASLILLCFTTLLGAAPSYKLATKYAVPGDGGFDYLTVDEQGRRIYVSHGTEVNVLDADTGSITGKIEGTKGVHGIALAPEFHRGFVSNGQLDTVTIFDTRTLAKVGEAKTGKKPDAIFYDEKTKRVLAANGDSNSITVIEAADGKVAGTIDLGGAPEFMASDGNGSVFVNLEDKSETLKLDVRQMKVMNRWPVAPCESPSSMAMDRKTNRLFVGCANQKLAVLNATTGKVVTTIPIGDHVDATAFDASNQLIFSACGDGTLWIIHEDSADKYSAVQTVQTQQGAKTLAFDPKTRNIFLSAAEYGPIPAGKKRPALKPGSFAVLVVAP